MSANRIVWAVVLVGFGAAAGLAQSTVPPSTTLFGGSPKPPLPGSVTQAQATAPPLATVPPAVDTLTAPVTNPGLPGAVYSPWCGDQPAGGCNGPVGANGPVTYEGYLRTGPALVLGGGELSAVLKTGWNVQGGSRTLFFNPEGDAAWVLDLGIGFTRNNGPRLDRPSDILESSLKGGPVNSTNTISAGVRALHRTSLNFAVGRDYFLNGPGVVGRNEYGNMRWGWDVGGRWGTSSLQLEPVDDPGGYRHRQSVYHGLFLGTQWNWEKPFHSWTFVIGTRLEWSYYWTNIIPPQDGDFRDLNILMMFGVRF